MDEMFRYVLFGGIAIVILFVGISAVLPIFGNALYTSTESATIGDPDWSTGSSYQVTTGDLLGLESGTNFGYHDQNITAWRASTTGVRVSANIYNDSRTSATLRIETSAGESATINLDDGTNTYPLEFEYAENLDTNVSLERDVQFVESSEVWTDNATWQDGTFQNTQVVNDRLTLEADATSGSWTSPTFTAANSGNLVDVLRLYTSVASFNGGNGTVYVRTSDDPSMTPVVGQDSIALDSNQTIDIRPATYGQVEVELTT